MAEMKMDPLRSLWRDAWNLYSDRFAVMVQIMIAPVLLMALGSVVQSFGVFPAALVGSVILAAGFLLSIVAGASLIYAFHHSTGFDESYRAGGRLFWRLIWLAILVGFAALGAFVLFVIPGIWLMITLTFSTYVLVLEGKSGFAALSQSREYAKGYWWAILGRIMLLIIAFVVVYIVIGIPFVVVGGVIGRALASAIISLFMAPFSIAYYYAMYRNLTVLKPRVREGVASGSKTFFIVAQVVGVVIVLLAAAGLARASIFGYGGHGQETNPVPFVVNAP